MFPINDLVDAFGEEDVQGLLDERTTDFRRCGDSINGRIAFDYCNFLPWMLMPKVDRMSMAHAVEVRAPLLDHNLVDQWALVSDSEKVRGVETKIRIKKFCVNKGIIAERIAYRKKAGMNLPLSWWIRQNEAIFRDVVFADDSASIDFFGKGPAAQWFEEVCRESDVGWTRSAQKIWTIFMFELWNRNNRNVIR